MIKKPRSKPRSLPGFGAVRVIVEIAGNDRRMATDFPQCLMQEWLDTMGGLVTTPLIHGEEGALHAREIFRAALVREEHPMMACLCAVWISLYGPGSVPGMGLTLDDLQTAQGGILTVTVSADRCRWAYVLTGRNGNQGGRRTVPNLDFDTIGNA